MILLLVTLSAQNLMHSITEVLYSSILIPDSYDDADSANIFKSVAMGHTVKVLIFGVLVCICGL